MIIRIGLLGLLLSCCLSCVSSKIYDDLKSNYEVLQAENEQLSAQLDALNNKESQGPDCQEQINTIVKQLTQTEMELAALQNNYDRLKASYDALEANSSELLAENLARNRELLTQLEAREKALAVESGKIQNMLAELNAKAKRVAELEALIHAKEAQMADLKAAISAALVDFEGQGLTVEQRDGKVYVSMENKLLFSSGSWEVNSNGKTAVVALARVLADNPEISVLIEGHTDNVPYNANGNIKDNWDLSTKRATAIVNIIIDNARLDPMRLTAAGRGKYNPVADNSTVAGRSANRRIEVILTPKLDKISELLNQIED